MNDAGRPDEHYRFIGKPLPRKEDARLITGKGRFTDDFNLDGQAYAAMVRSPYPHARIVAIDAARGARRCRACSASSPAPIALADGLEPIPHDPVPKTKFDMKLTGPGGGAVFIGPHMLLPADKARHVGEAVAMVVAETKAQAHGCRRGGRGATTRNCRSCCIPKTRWRPGAPAVWDEAPDNVLVDTLFGDAEATDRGLRARPRMSWRKISMSAASPACRSSRAPRSADYDAATGRYTLYAGSRRRGAAEERACRRARHRAGQPARALPRRRRQFRHPQPRLCRVRPGAVGGEQARPPGEIHRHALGSFLSDYQGRDLVTKVELALDAKTAASSRCAPPISAMSARAACRCRR